MEDGCHLKNVKCDISAAIPLVLMKFSLTMHISPPILMGKQKIINLKIKEGGRWPS